MLRTKKIFTSFLEAISYGFFSSIFVFIILVIEDFLLTVPCDPNFSCDTGGRGIPPGGVLIGAAFSVIFWNLLFGKIIQSNFVKWFLILITSSITAILFQTAYLISITHLTNEQIISIYFGEERLGELFGVDLMIKLFIILTPFTILFANFHSIIEKIKNRNALK